MEPRSRSSSGRSPSWWTSGRQMVNPSCSANRGRAIWAVPANGGRKPRMLIDTAYDEDEVHVSPNGRWVAYSADESGRWEAYVATFPGFTSKRQISGDGGVQPQWSRDGRELFYLTSDSSMMSVRVTPGPEFVGGPPSRLFAVRIQPIPYTPQYAVTADGQRFLGLQPIEGERNTMMFLLNCLGTSSRSTPIR